MILLRSFQNQKKNRMITDFVELCKTKSCVSYTPTLRKNIEQNLQKKVHELLKNDFRTIVTPGNGHCFYNAVSYVLFKNFKFNLTIRLICTNFIVKHIEYFKYLEKACIIDSVLTLLKNIAVLDVTSVEQWGDNSCIIALCLGLNRNFLVNITSTQTSLIKMFQSPNTVINNFPICLVLDGNHYSSFISMIKGQKLVELLKKIEQHCLNNKMIEKLDIQTLKNMLGDSILIPEHGSPKANSVNNSKNNFDNFMDVTFSDAEDISDDEKIDSLKNPIENTKNNNEDTVCQPGCLEDYLNKSFGDLKLSDSDSYIILSDGDYESRKNHKRGRKRKVKGRVKPLKKQKEGQSPIKATKRKNQNKNPDNKKKRKINQNEKTEFLIKYFKYRQDQYEFFKSNKKNDKLFALKLNFLDKVNKMAEQICICCEGLFYNIRKFNKKNLFEAFNKIHEKNPELLISEDDFTNCIMNTEKFTGICYTCFNDIKKGKVPLLSTSSSGLKLPVLPDCVKNLTELEERFVCPYVNFIKFVCLKTYDPNAQLGAKGSVVNIPTDLEEMITTLPRTFDECKYVHVVFKRKLEHQTKYLEENINVKRVMDALIFLNETPLYKEYNINIDKARLKQFEGRTCVPVSELDEGIQAALKCMLKEDAQNEENDDIYTDFDAMVVKNLITTEDCTEQKIIMAPGEGKKPMSRYKIENYDRLIMPSVFGGQPEPFVNRKPHIIQSDSDSDNENQTVKNLSRTKKYKSWLRNADPRIRKPRYVLHMAKVKLEEQVMNNKMIMLRKSSGSNTVTDILDNEKIDKLISNDQAFNMFKNIRGSPTYWNQKRKDIFSMFRQFGPATLFFTLSQGETYEPALLQHLYKLQKGQHISLENALMLDDSVKAELIRNDPVSCVELFNNKIKEFIKYLKHKDGPFKDNPVEHIIYRIEYQMRGSMHCHGMIWLKDAPKFDPDDPSTFEPNEIFIDKYVSVLRDTSNPLLSFQQHKDSFTCHKGKKNKNKCRFNFPRPPMNKTRILLPLPENIQNNDKEQAKSNFKLLSKKLKSLTKAKGILLSEYKDFAFEDFLKLIDMNEDNYILAIRSSLKEPTVFYKRNVYSIMTNNYNDDWLIWNANLDIQFLHNSYRAVYYVAEYISKDPAGVSNVILEAKKKAEEGNVAYKNMLDMVAQSFVNFNYMCAQEGVNQIMG